METNMNKSEELQNLHHHQRVRKDNEPLHHLPKYRYNEETNYLLHKTENRTQTDMYSDRQTYTHILHNYSHNINTQLPTKTMWGGAMVW